ncbi:MAG TPA: aminopeptidase P family N-terminal domain-containing protein, partial [Hyphomicrobiales bacterium]|nr:aminopeptidase P family N-terminal domain-containing protein [Hyphomicrobiales bacterium]
MQEHAAQASQRLNALRVAIRSLGLAGFIVPKSDEFQNESVPAYADRLAWLTGFTGSAGHAVILEDKAALIVDSRYTLQAKAQLGEALYSIELFPKTTLASYLTAHSSKGGAIGYDPALHTLAGFKALKKAAEKAGFDLKPCSRNPIDALWLDRPAPEFAPIFIHEEAFAGESASSKLARVRKAVGDKDATGLFVSAPDSVAWLFNIRGRDVRHTPTVLARAYVPLTGRPSLFTQPGHITPENKGAIGKIAEICGLTSLADTLPGLMAKGQKILTDPERTPLAIAEMLKESGAALVEESDPCTLFKARKNPVELQGARNAQRRDAVAMCRFLAWLDAEASSGAVDEIAASDKLQSFRRALDLFEDVSFDTISGAGAHGAIVHYRATAETNRRLLPGTLYLIDSGGQYRDGTTDVTRTIAVGAPTDEMRRHYTLVLKGHIAIATTLFPEGTRGVDIDAFARRALWAAGL